TKGGIFAPARACSDIPSLPFLGVSKRHWLVGVLFGHTLGPRPEKPSDAPRQCAPSVFELPVNVWHRQGVGFDERLQDIGLLAARSNRVVFDKRRRGRHRFLARPLHEVVTLILLL